MIILGIETSCDETATAVVQKLEDRVIILSNVVASSAVLQAKYGGVIPEQAAREQIKFIIPVIEESLQVSGYRGQDINAIAVTYGPGLIGSLLVGVETAKTLALVWKKPLIPVNHLIGHFYANWIAKHLRGVPQAQHHLGGEIIPQFPCIGLLVSGGHTDLVLFTDHGKYKYLGGTRDDAAGECFDKCARLLGLPYPGGPQIAKLAQKGNPQAFDLPRPMIDSDDFDFSFSGLKTAVANLLKEAKFGPAKAIGAVERTTESMIPITLCAKQTNSERTGRARGALRSNEPTIQDLAASIEAAIVDVLVEKTIKAVKLYHVDQIMIAGGVAANQKLTSDLKLKVKSEKLKVKIFVPPPNLCTDNAAMIAAAAFFNYQPIDPLALQVNPSLSLNSL